MKSCSFKIPERFFRRTYFCYHLNDIRRPIWWYRLSIAYCLLFLCTAFSITLPICGEDSQNKAVSHSLPIGAWLFFFANNDSKTDYSGVDVDDMSWDVVQLPDANSKLNCKRYLYGWYRWHFTLPEAFEGRPLEINLGRIVDLDWTYLNGELIGRTTDNKMGWRLRRRYQVPGALVRGGENVLAVKVQKLWSIAGILSKPCVGVKAVSTESMWQMAQIAYGAKEPKLPPAGAVSWNAVLPLHPVLQDKRGQWRWYRLNINLPLELKGQRLALEFGYVGDAYTAFINDTAFSSAGSFPPNFVKVETTYSRLLLPANIIRYANEGDNILDLKVYLAPDSKVTQTPAIPTLWLDLPGAPLEAIPSRGVDPAAALEVARKLRQKGKLREAQNTIRAILSDYSEHRRTTAYALGESVVLYSQAGNAKKAFEVFTHLQSEYPEQPYSSEVVDAIVNYQNQVGTIAPNCFYLGEDRHTKGDWTGAYGKYAHILCAMEQYDLAGGEGWPIPYRFRTADPTQTAKVYLGHPSISDRRALLDPFRRSRTFAWRDDYGEHYNFQLGGPDLLLDLSLRSGNWLIALYIVDPDWSKTPHPRDLSIIILDESSRPIAVARAVDLVDGVYYRFLCSGPRQITLRICKHLSPDANLSGVFLDKVTPLRTVPFFIAQTELTSHSSEIRRVYEQFRDLANILTGNEVSWRDRVKQLRELKSNIGKCIDWLGPGRPVSGILWMFWQVSEQLADWSDAQKASKEFVAAVTNESGTDWPDVLLELLDSQAVRDSATMREEILTKLASSREMEVASQAILDLARLRMRLLKDGAAIEAYESLLKKYPTRALAAEAHYAMGAIYYKQQKKSEAIAEFEAVLRCTTDDNSEAALARQFLSALRAMSEKEKERGNK